MQIGNELVYIEVVVPDESEEHKWVASLLGDLAKRLLGQNHGFSINVFLLVEPTLEVADSICDLVERGAAAPAEAVHELSGVGFAQSCPSSVRAPWHLPCLSRPIQGFRTFQLRE